MRDSIKRLLAIMLSFALVFTMIPMIPGAVEKAHAETIGSSITITDATGNQFVIDTTEGGSTENHTGDGYVYDAVTNTLTLNGFSGKQILSNGDFNLHLIGENTITLEDSMATGGRIYGLKAETAGGAYCRVTVTADDGGTLNITGEDLTTSAFVWYASTNFTNGTLDIDVSTTSGILYGIYGGMTFTEDETDSATLNVNVVNEGDNAAIGLGNGGILIENRDNVTINVDAKADYQATALSVLQIIDAAPVITAKATKLDGTTIGAKQRAVSEPIYYMQLTEGGQVTLDGMIVVYEGRISWNENTIVTTPANSAYYWAAAKEIDQYASNDYVYMKNLDGTPVTKAVFEYSADPTRTLKYNGEGLVSVPAGKVGTSISPLYLHRYISGELDSRGSGDSYMVYEITDGSLPAGLTLGRNNGRISGTPTAAVAAGQITVKATDHRGTYYDAEDDQSITFTVPYGEIVEADRFITVGGTKAEVKSDASGAGWEYDADTKTLTLNGYNGGNILSEVDFNLHLKGTNTITLEDSMATGGRIYGLKAETASGAYCSVTVVADEGGILNIKGEDLTTSAFVWYASTNFTSGTLDIDVSTTSGILYGIYGGMTFTEDETDSATLNVNVVNEGDNAAIGLGNGGILIENRDNVTINVDAKADYQATALSVLQIIDAAPVITAKATKLDGTIGAKQRAVSEPIYYMQLTEGGKVTLDGMIVVYEGRISWNENTLVTTPANSAYYWAAAKEIDQYASNDYVYMKNLDGTPVTKAVFEYSADPTRTLKYNGEGLVSVPAGKVGTSISPLYLHRYISGELDSRGSGDSYMVYEITDGSLPEGLTLGRNNGRIYGTPTAKAEAGTIEVTVTDHRGTYYDAEDDQSITFTVPYGAIASAKPVTAVTLNKDEIIINQGENAEFTATVTPVDASYADVSVTRQNFNIVAIDSIGEPVDGITTISIQGGTNVGKDILTVTSKDTGVKKEISVYVKDAKPKASQNDDYITGLIANTKYTVDGIEYTADAYGQIPILTAWRLQTLEIAKVNDEPKCNSDAQELTIAAQPLKEAWVNIEDEYVVYDGAAKEPAVTVNNGTDDLVKDTDYTVAYTDNTAVGDAKVTITGIGKYSGTVEKTFRINGINIKNAEVTLSKEQYDYNGTEHKPGATVVLGGNTLLEDTDYTVEYSKNINAGTGIVTIIGKGVYEGSLPVIFTINPISIEGKTLTLSATSVTYNGKAQEPAVTIEGLTADDYDVTYTDNINAGTATVTITGKGNYTGTLSDTFTINKQAYSSKFKASLSATAFTYNGKKQTPSVTVYDPQGKKLVKDTDYTLKFSSTKRTSIARYYATITFKGNYSGSTKLYFTIGPKNPSSVKTTLYGYDDVKVSWSKVSGASGYRVYYKKSGASSYTFLKTTTSTSYKKSNLSDGAKYYFKVVAYKTVSGNKCYNAGKTSSIYTLKKVSGVKATKSSSKVKISWTNIAGESGYQISKSTSKSKTGTITTYKTTSGKSKTISATKGKTYYYKVRAYKVVDGKKIYAPWSSVVKYKR